MNEVERRALKALRFNWAPTPDDVWRQPSFHVEGLHRDALRVILDGVDDADRSTDSSPVGVAVLGQRGSGKTHLLGSAREHVQAGGGYFFLVSLLEASAFWRSTALSILDGLNRETAERESQLRTFLRRLADLIGAPRAVRRAVTGEAELTRPILDAFVDLLRKHNRQVGIDCQDTARALVLQAAEKLGDQDVGYEFLCSNDELEPGQRAAWGMRRARRSAQEIVRDVSRLLALTGPTVIAVDQIDLLINQAAKSLDGETRLEWRAALLLEQIAGGLMALRETTRRTLSVVACLDESWALVKTQATDTVQDRFREAVQLRQIGTAELGRELIARRFAEPFADQGFVPAYPTWPVRASAFVEAVQFTPRELLRTIDTHVRGCLRDETVREMSRLVHDAVAAPAGLTEEPTTDDELAAVDARFAALLGAADPAEALDPATEDAAVPALLEAGLTAWIGARGGSGELFGLDPHPGNKPALHARLRRSLDERTEDEEHWAFRVIGARHPIAALNRIRNASTAAGLTEGVAKRKLFFLRNEPWSGGARTTEVIETFSRAGGRTLAFPSSDVVVLVALRQLLRERGYETLRPWFVSRRPADRIAFLAEALAGADAPAPTPAGAPPAPAVSAGPERFGPERLAGPAGPDRPGPERLAGPVGSDRPAGPPSAVSRARQAGLSLVGGTAVPVASATDDSPAVRGLSAVPDAPEAPGGAGAPGGPVVPGDASAPGGPAAPVDSAVPGGPGVRGGSAVPGGPGMSGGPAARGGPAAPGGPTVLDGSAVPGGAAAQGGSAVPGGPAAPGGPVVLGGPVVPGGPAARGGSAVPGGPAAQGGSAVPGHPAAQGGSAVPGGPAVPGAPGAHGGPAVPGGPAASDGQAAPGSWAARAGAAVPGDPAGSRTPDEPAASGSWMARAGAFLRGAPAVRDGSPPPDEPAVPGSWAARAGATAPSDPAGSPTPDEPAAPGSWAARAGAAARGVPAARDGSDPTDEPAVPGSWAARASATAPSGPGVRDGSAAPGGPAAPGSWAARDGAAAHGGPVAPGGHAAATVAGGPVDPAPTLATVRRLPVRVPREDRDPGSVMLGQSVQDGRSVSVELAALRRHAAIFAGSGSGKTVLIRRLVEECALRGVSSIVLDPNNDLARLGDPWPQPPAAWDELEVARAEAYHRSTDVVVWTPRRTAGRPLSFRPLPDFAGILDDPDAFAAGVDAAVASLAPRANVDGASTKARIGNAVLREALTAYARGGGSDLREFVLYLTRLPARVSQLDNAPKVANELGQLLRATMVSDPLFGGDGAPLDPGELLKPAPGYRARISVISFIGLPDDGQRQSFVNQLQLALFAWIKRHPAGDRPLGGLLVMDEAQTLAPSGAMTACTQSTLALASQARKYGLGLVFATQAPKGLHNRIPGNAATQLFGLLNSPTQIEAAKEMARAKGSDISDVARLRPGVFYAAVDGAGFAKMRAPLCLSHHPASPLTVEEVIARAQDVDDDDDE